MHSQRPSNISGPIKTKFGTTSYVETTTKSTKIGTSDRNATKTKTETNCMFERLFKLNTTATKQKILNKIDEKNRGDGEGYVYGFTINGDETWCKLGRTRISVDKRISQQGGKLLFSTHTKDCFKLERLIHMFLQFCNAADAEHQGIEWFHIGPTGLKKNDIQRLVCELDELVLSSETEEDEDADEAAIKAPNKGRAIAITTRTDESIKPSHKTFKPPTETSDTTSDDSSKKVNINTASKEMFLTDLAHCRTLRGRAIGDKLADRIIDYRNRSRFMKISDLQNVPMIGPITYNAVKDYICV